MTNSDKTSLGDRMKRYEEATRAVLPRRTYTIIRLDGRAFHTYTRGLQRPFDAVFLADMSTVAQVLCKEVSGTVFAYAQSDEISLLLADFDRFETEPWFGGVVQKMTSVAASIATGVLIRLRGHIGMPTFDARVFTIADPLDVRAYFQWRQHDAVRNSIAMTAQAHFSAKELHGVNTSQMQEKLFAEKGINWNDTPDDFKRGRVIVKCEGERETHYIDKRTNTASTTLALRTWWEARPAPHFTGNQGDFLNETIPLMLPKGWI